MKKIYLNLERFDVPKIFDGISKFEKNESYGSIIGSGIENMDLALPVTIFFQELNLLDAIRVTSKVKIGCQGVHYEDIEKGKNFDTSKGHITKDFLVPYLAFVKENKDFYLVFNKHSAPM